MAPDPAERTQALIDQLRQHRHHAEADHLARQLLLHEGEAGLLFALREACETVLTGIEAIDPVSQTMIEVLRLEVEQRLRVHEGDRDMRPAGWAGADQTDQTKSRCPNCGGLGSVPQAVPLLPGVVLPEPRDLPRPQCGGTGWIPVDPDDPGT